MKNSLIMIGFFVAGVLIGLFVYIPSVLLDSGFEVYVLYLLMFLVGVSIGSDTTVWHLIKVINVKIIFVPLSVVIGTVIGTGMISFFLSDLTLSETLAIGSGFGYYSLSSILLTQIRGETLGIIALLSNIFREIVTIVCAPLLARYVCKLAPIASGGATSMDTTLPIITRSAGKEYATISVFSGTVLTIVVPFFVTVLAKL
jgi:uncharacterized membrane protein YbjE (DUF340 family)